MPQEVLAGLGTSVFGREIVYCPEVGSTQDLAKSLAMRGAAEGTTVAYVLADDATVTLRLFTLSGDLVRREVFERGAEGGQAGANEWVWDGRNGSGSVVASGGYIALLEAQGAGETLHVVRRKIAVIR